MAEANFGCYSKFCHAFLSIPRQQELNEDFFNDLQLLFSGLRLISPPFPSQVFHTLIESLGRFPRRRRARPRRGTSSELEWSSVDELGYRSRSPSEIV